MKIWSGRTTDLVVPFAAAILLASISSAAQPPGWLVPRGIPAQEVDAQPMVITQVSDSKALAYANNRKFVIDSRGRAYCAIRTKGPPGTGPCFLHSSGLWPNLGRLDPSWLEDRPDLQVSTAAQRHPSIDLAPDATVHLVWYGGTSSQPAHQIRYAHFATTGSVQLVEETQPFTVAGFESVYTSVPTGDELWQEHPCVASGPDGLYLAWEARDRWRLNSTGACQPGIAWAVRTADGRWSVTGTIDRPPYAQVDRRFPSQSRPTLVAGANGEMHILCYGSVSGVQQVLHGTIKNRVFSGWQVVCPSSGDQRQVSAAADATGRVHLAWREGAASPRSAMPGKDQSADDPSAAVATGSGIAVRYASIDPGGRVTGPIQVSPTGESGSTPSIAVSGGRVWIAWVGWNPGDLNSEGKPDNGYPSDNATVEGRLEIRNSPSTAAGFGPVVTVDPGRVSYPTWAFRYDAAGPPEALVWTRVEAGRSQLMLGRILSP